MNWNDLEEICLGLLLVALVFIAIVLAGRGLP